MALDAGTLLMIAVTFTLAGLVKGVTGMGLPTVAMGLLGALISPVAAAGMLLLPSVVTNLFQLGPVNNIPHLVRRLWPMLLMVAAITPLTSDWIAVVDAARTVPLLGGALIVYALWTLSGRMFSVPAGREKALSGVVGTLTGMLTGCTGVFVIPAVPWLQSLRLERDELVQALGIAFTCSTFALAAGLWWHGALRAETVSTSVWAVFPALLGMYLGQRLRKRISPLLFKRCFLICLAGLGLEMVMRAV